MLTYDEREIAISIVEALVEYGINDHLAQYGKRCIEDWFDNMELGRWGFGASAGATKSCIWHRDLDNWVIKVGHTENVTKNYAKVEYENYCAAEEAGFGYYFPETVFLGEFGGQCFYVQQYAECCEDEVTSEWYDRLRDQCEEDGEEYDCDSLWNMVYDLADEEKAMLMFHDPALCEFLSDYRIGDLHEGNFGYIGGKCVIVDFSGFHG